jgi:multicomponent Na+:H+ antiporter subunit C
MPALDIILTFILGHYNYLAAIVLIMIGIYTVVSRPNLIKKIIGLNLFQNGVFLFFISVGAAENGEPPILIEGVSNYANPLPHVLILTAIVVGVSTMAVGLALVVRIGEAYGTIESTEIAALDKI